jgi:RNA polymerase sigma-70 factor, ECF subfamily
MESALTSAMDMAVTQGRAEGIATEEFDHIVSSHQRRVFQVLFSLVRDRDVADNLTQECFLRAYQKRATFRGEASIETWLIRIAVNLARDHVRNRRLAFWRNILQRPATPENSGAELEAIDRQPSVEQALLAREQMKVIESTLGRISAQQRTAFSLRFFEEMTLAEIASAMELEIGTVKAHLFRAVTAVRNKLKEQKQP